MRTPLFVPVALSLAVIAASPALADEWHKSFPIGSSPSLSVVTSDADVRVGTWDRHEIDVRVVTEGYAIPRQVRVSAEQTGDAVAVEVRWPSVRFDFNFGLSGHPRRVRILITAPARGTLDLHTGDGDIEVGPFAGTVRASSGDGSIVLDRPHGTIELRSGDGRVEALNVEGELSAITGDGRIRVSGNFTGLEVRTGDGGISVDAGATRSLSREWSLRSGDGPVSLRIPRNLGAALDASTSDGRVDVDVPVRIEGRMNPHHIRGVINGGGPLLRVRTGDGSILIESS